ncbi:MAG: hypothetical protein Q7U63_03225 [Polaromonas sp.]|uniref:hypothetical protein n=1 Tax=Polaromonas sp. TaxID=1869339 RepID=UPI0024895455|nr:hypothetical protein [Polaromonas sp.]MDI1268956.1 hypothetical protein [Polaromonas sp.]MDO9112788.1 hypothetical protein [Polaromonas sp.]MDP1886754.1 hypothetical protein [Polaromonas sp.]
MPQSSKDNNGGKNHPAKDGGRSAAKPADKAPKNPHSPVGAQNKGEKKTTP